LASPGEFARLVERQNLIMRKAIAAIYGSPMLFSKKLSHLKAAVALLAYYNFCRVHSALRVTTRNGSGISTHIWIVNELLS
jgi:hypothetical protein